LAVLVAVALRVAAVTKTLAAVALQAVAVAVQLQQRQLVEQELWLAVVAVTQALVEIQFLVDLQEVHQQAAVAVVLEYLQMEVIAFQTRVAQVATVAVAVVLAVQHQAAQAGQVASCFTTRRYDEN
jgi:uncharacterized membrane-anchored protein